MAKATKQDQQLVSAARAAQRNAYAPYSDFPVGAAVRTRGGAIYSACNVENASYGLSCCAERNAVYAAVAAGDREIEAVAVVADTAAPVSPCGACRQVLSEFNPLMTVIMASRRGVLKKLRLDRLLPYSFQGKSLKTKNQK
jgi:cytidine deaminase